VIRFIIRRHLRDGWTGLATTGYETFDVDVPDLQYALMGGSSEDGSYDWRELVGVEVLPDSKEQG